MTNLALGSIDFMLKINFPTDFYKGYHMTFKIKTMFNVVYSNLVRLFCSKIFCMNNFPKKIFKIQIPNLLVLLVFYVSFIVNLPIKVQP